MADTCGVNVQRLVIMKRERWTSANYLLLSVVNGCGHLQWFRHLVGYEDVELSIDETVSLAWNVEHTIL